MVIMTGSCLLVLQNISKNNLINTLPVMFGSILAILFVVVVVPFEVEYCSFKVCGIGLEF